MRPPRSRRHTTSVASGGTRVVNTPSSMATFRSSGRSPSKIPRFTCPEARSHTSSFSSTTSTRPRNSTVALGTGTGVVGNGTGARAVVFSSAATATAGAPATSETTTFAGPSSPSLSHHATPRPTPTTAIAAATLLALIVIPPRIAAAVPTDEAPMTGARAPAQCARPPKSRSSRVRS